MRAARVAALILAACGALLVTEPALAQAPRATVNKVTLGANPQLFATLCALEASGFGKESSAAGVHPLRARLRAELLRLQGPATQELRAYYAQHRAADPAATFSRFVSFALVSGPPPRFNLTLPHDELPPDVLPIEDFGGVLAKFSEEAGIPRLWAQVQPEYAREIERLGEPISQLVLVSTAYLRELLQTKSPRTFAVYVELLVGGKTSFRNYGDRYSLVISPGAEIPVDDIRHALLHFLLDPLAIRYPHVVAAKRPLLDFAAHAPRLPAEYKDDFHSFTTECLVRAVELRLRRLPAEKLAAAVDQSESEGYVLVRPFLRELSKFEQAEPAMNLYFPDLVRGVSVAEESKRLRTVTFAPAAPAQTETPAGAGATATDSAPAAAEDPEIAALLAEGDQQIAARNPAAAIAAFERVLAKQPGQPRALYGRAVAAILQGDADRAKEMFQRLVADPPQPASGAPGKDPLILAWSHVYLGRIYDVDGERDLALSEYRAALIVEGAPEAARQAARRGMQKGYEPQPRNP